MVCFGLRMLLLGVVVLMVVLVFVARLMFLRFLIWLLRGVVVCYCCLLFGLGLVCFVVIELIVCLFYCGSCCCLCFVWFVCCGVCLFGVLGW